MNTQSLSSQQITSLEQASKTHGITALFNGVFGAIARMLIARDEIKVSVERLRNGEQVWHVYDPLSDRTESFISEADALSWLDSKSMPTSVFSRTQE